MNSMRNSMRNSMGVARMQPVHVSPRMGAVGWSLALFLVWMAATYLLEGRVDLIRQSPIGWGRWAYVLTANIVVGTLGVTWLLRTLRRGQIATPQQMGLRSLPRTLLAAGLALVAGAALLGFQQQVRWTPLLLVNTFALVLQTTIAEVMVCWAALGVSVEVLARPRGRVVALLSAVVVSDLLFGLYHYAHSAPFNQTWMVVMLLLPGLVTSLVFFLGRDIYAAMIVQNCLGMIGVAQSINQEIFARPLLPLYLLTTLSLAALIGSHVLLRGQTKPTKQT